MNDPKLRQDRKNGVFDNPYAYPEPDFLDFLIRAFFVVVILTAIVCIFWPGNSQGSEVVSIAQSQIGLGEKGGNNRGPVVRKYTKGQNLPWCAGFVSWTLSKAGKNTPYLLRAKNYLKIGKRVSRPKPGDLIVFNRKGGGHVGIIESVKGKKITTIEGNVGDYPAKVKRYTYIAGKIPNFIAFVEVA